MHLFVTISRFFGYLALRLYSHGPLPESAFHSSMSGERSAGSAEFRRVYVAGQVVGWTLIALAIATIAGLLLITFG